MTHRRRTALLTAVVIGLTAVAAACGSSTDRQDTPVSKALTAEERVQWYEQCWNHFNDKQWTAFRQCYADNATSEQMGYGTPSVSGADAIVASSQDFAKMAPDGRGDAQLILVNGHYIASIFLLSGTNAGPLAGPDHREMQATNRKFGLLFGHVVELDRDAPKVIKERGVMDGGTLAYQLGLSKEGGRPLMANGVAAPLVVVARNDEAERRNLETDQAAFAAWNTHKATANDAFNATDLVMHDTTFPKDTSRAENSAVNAMFWNGFSDAELSNLAMWSAGDYVVVTGVFEGTNDGEFPPMNLKRSGRRIALPFIEIDRFDAGKLKESWFFMDSAMLASQLTSSTTAK